MHRVSLFAASAAKSLLNLAIHGRATDQPNRGDFGSTVIARLLADLVSVFISVKSSQMLRNRSHFIAHCREITHHQIAWERPETFQ
jgi:hypothetical protein